MQSAVPDLGALLARISAAQSASPTAQAHYRLVMGGDSPNAPDPHVALFTAAPAFAASGPASFSAAFSPRKPS